MRGKKSLFVMVFLCFLFADVSAEGIPARKNAIKSTFLSWFTGSCKLSYERAVFNNQTMELTAGYIGIGFDKHDNNPKGFTARYAHKFILSGNEIRPLNGFYLRPELIYSRFNYDQKDTGVRKTSEMESLVFTVGYQYVVRRFVADAFFGGGYARGNPADTNYQHGFMLWDYFGRYNKHIAMTFGVKLGVCF